MRSNLRQWFRTSHRWQHLAGGFAVGFACGIDAAVAVAAALEFKDRQWGGKPEWIDFALTVAGGMLGSFLRWLVIGRFM